MDEYINRKHAIENVIWAKENHMDECEALEDTIAADVVPVVRCRECKYFEKNPFCAGHWLCQRRRAMTMEPNDFCSYGERRKHHV